MSKRVENRSQKESLLRRGLAPFIAPAKSTYVGPNYSEEIKLARQSSDIPSPNIASAGSLSKTRHGNFTALLEKPDEPAAETDSEKASLLGSSEKKIGPARSRFGRMFEWATSKGVVRAVNIIVPAVAFAGIGSLSGGIVPAVALGLAGGTMLYNSIRDTRHLRILKELEREHNLLYEYHLAKNATDAANGILCKARGVEPPAPNPISMNRKKHKFSDHYEDYLLERSLGNTIRDSLFESAATIATVAVVATSGLANAAVNAMSFGISSSVLGVVDIVKSTKERKQMKVVKGQMVRNIEAWSADVPNYSSINELQGLVRKQKIESEAIKQIANYNVRGMDDEELEKGLTMYRIDAGLKAPPVVEPSFWQRTKQYFKDFNSVQWPNNDYCTAKRFVSKLDEDNSKRTREYIISLYDTRELVRDNTEATEQIPAPVITPKTNSPQIKRSSSLATT